MNFKFVADDALAAGIVKARDFGPVQFRDKIGDRLALDVRWKGQEADNRLITVEDACGFIDHEDTIFNGIKKGLKKGPLASQALDDTLQALCVETADPSQNLVEEVGFRRHAESWARLAGSSKRARSLSGPQKQAC